MTVGPRAVFDSCTLLQALVSPAGPSHGCVSVAWADRCTLSVSDSVLSELHELAHRPDVRARFRLGVQKIELFIDDLRAISVHVPDVPSVFVHPIDPKDSQYVDLAARTGSTFLVSRDRHLLELMDRRRPSSKEFLERFPSVQIINPPQFLRVLGERFGDANRHRRT